MLRADGGNHVLCFSGISWLLQVGRLVGYDTRHWLKVWISFPRVGFGQSTQTQSYQRDQVTKICVLWPLSLQPMQLKCRYKMIRFYCFEMKTQEAISIIYYPTCV